MRHIDFWNQECIVNDQQTFKGLLEHESYLISNLNLDYKNKYFIRIVGCGTGREVLPLIKMLPNSVFRCEDVANKMIEKAKILIGNNENVSFKVVSISTDDKRNHSKYDIVICFNSILNYICPHNNRIRALENIFQSLKNEGKVIGVVHSVFDNFPKSIFFMAKFLLMLFSDNKYQKYLGFKSILGAWTKKDRVLVNYYTKSSLKKYLLNNFKIIELTTIKNIIKRKLKKRFNYNSNYLVFTAQKKI